MASRLLAALSKTTNVLTGKSTVTSGVCNVYLLGVLHRSQ
ncbi:hypothetical protein A2U01_0076893, partial [Trifolium medium]|nr:hypothetical protein [Trifolium medium]